jgi:hypothetical protein
MEPLGLPRGSVRAIITLMLLVVCAVMLFIPAVDSGAREMFLLLTGIAVRDYFATRAKQNAEDGPPVEKPHVNVDAS